MKEIIYVDCNNPEKILKENYVYTIELGTGTDNTDIKDIEQIAYLRSIHQLGYKTHAIIKVVTIEQAFGQIYALINHCDRIHLYINPAHTISQWEAFTLVYKEWKIKSKTKIYFSTEFLDLVRDFIIPLDIRNDWKK